MARLGVSLKECSAPVDTETIDVLVVVDSSNPSQLGGLAALANKEGPPVILIDHHQPGLIASIAKLQLVDSSAASTTELVSSILAELALCVEPREASLALAGIVYDSRRFRIIGSHTFRASLYLQSCGASLVEVESKGDTDFSERFARIKAASRLRPARICSDIILAVTRVGSFESSVARALLELGADVAVVVGGGGEPRVSIRTSKRALENGIRADEIAVYIAGKYGGEGGGHKQAAMVHLNAGPDPSILVEELSRSLPGKLARLCVEWRGSHG